jgi:hypothetical protein
LGFLLQSFALDDEPCPSQGLLLSCSFVSAPSRRIIQTLELQSFALTIELHSPQLRLGDCVNHDSLGVIISEALTPATLSPSSGRQLFGTSLAPTRRHE